MPSTEGKNFSSRDLLSGHRSLLHFCNSPGWLVNSCYAVANRKTA